MKFTKMNHEVKEKWVAALRSGEYKQGHGLLAKDVGGKVEYCCLGVLCDLAIKSGLDIDVREGASTTGGIGYDGEIFILPESVVEWAGVESSPAIGTWNDVPIPAAVFNDGRDIAPGPCIPPHSFALIAALIEENL